MGVDNSADKPSGKEPSLGGELSKKYIEGNPNPRAADPGAQKRIISDMLHKASGLPELQYIRRIRKETGQSTPYVSTVKTAGLEGIMVPKHVVANNRDQYPQFLTGYGTPGGLEAVARMRIAQNALECALLPPAESSEPFEEAKVIGQIYTARTFAAHMGLNVKFLLSSDEQGEMLRHGLSILGAHIPEGATDYSQTRAELEPYTAAPL